MNAALAKSSRINAPSRCTQRFSNGKRCRLDAKPDSTLCPAHSATDAEDLAVTLTAGLDQFTSAAPINQFLSRLLLLLAQDRLSPRRGAVMAYTANLLLHTLPAMKKESPATGQKHHHTTIIWDLPAPAREHVDIPQAEVMPHAGGDRSQ